MGGTAELISKDELTSVKLLEIYQRAYIDASLDSDGEVRLNLDGLTMFAISYPDRGLLRFRLGFSIKPNATRQQLIELCNRINDQLIFIRASYPVSMEPGLGVLLDYYLDTTSGVTGHEIINGTRRFRSVVGGLPPLDTDRIIP